jgi:hypothetical protein
MNKMPSLQNKPAVVKPKKEIKTFGGGGVRLGSYIEETKGEDKTLKAKNTSFSGLKKQNTGKDPKIELKWRCMNCLTLNKVTENQHC